MSMVKCTALLVFHYGIENCLKVFISKDVVDIRLVENANSSSRKKASEQVSSGLATGYDLHNPINM